MSTSNASRTGVRACPAGGRAAASLLRPSPTPRRRRAVHRRDDLGSAGRNDTTRCRNPPTTPSCNPTPSSCNATTVRRDRRPRTSPGSFDGNSIRTVRSSLTYPSAAPHAPHSCAANGTRSPQQSQRKTCISAARRRGAADQAARRSREAAALSWDDVRPHVVARIRRRTERAHPRTTDHDGSRRPATRGQRDRRIRRRRHRLTPLER